jgi:hypothetical protein
MTGFPGRFGKSLISRSFFDYRRTGQKQGRIEFHTSPSHPVLKL